MARLSITIAGLCLCGALVPARLTTTASAQPSMPMPEQVVTLWPEGVPGARGNGGVERLEDGRVYNVQHPTLIFTPPDPGTATGTAVILCPGGGYVRLAIQNESAKVAQFLHPLGVATFVLKYRMSEFGHPAPLQDVLRAVRLVRARAREFGVDPTRIGVMGASAGGHVALSAATLFDAPEGRTGADLDATSGRPDFVALLYPVVTMEPPFAHGASVRALLGATPAAADVARLSLERQVSPQMPPMFIVHTAEDRSVPLENSLMLVAALRRAGVPTEFHLYERGEHGFGIAPGLGPTSSWQERLADWMRAHGWMNGPP